MTPDEFASKYDVHKRVAEGPVRSYFGRSRAKRVVALVHYLDGGNSPENAERLARVEALRGEHTRLVLDVCDVGGTPVVVTRFIMNFTTFDAWLATASAAPPTPPPGGELTVPLGASAAPAEPPGAPAAPPQQPATKAPGDFTQLFGQHKPPADAPIDISTAPTVRTERVAPPPSAKPPSPPQDTRPPAAPPGEFTKLFHAPEQAAGPPAPAPSQRGGEFTGLFAPGKEAAPGAPPPGTPPAPPPGAVPPAGTAPHRTPAPEPATPPSPKGDFTALFGKPATPGGAAPVDASFQGSPPPVRPAPPPPSLPLGNARDAEDDLSRRLRSTAPPPVTPPPAAATGPSPAEPTQPAAAPGDFTRMFGTPPPEPSRSARSQAPTFGPPPAQGPPTAPRQDPSSSPAADYLARLQGVPPASPPVAPPVTSPAPRGGIASEFTRALRRLSLSGLRAPEPEATAADAPSKAPRSPLPWVIGILGVLAVVAVGIVLYFVLTAG